MKVCYGVCVCVSPSLCLIGVLDFSCYALHDVAVMICTLMSIYWKTINKNMKVKRFFFALEGFVDSNILHTHHRGLFLGFFFLFFHTQKYNKDINNVILHENDLIWSSHCSLVSVILIIHQLEGKSCVWHWSHLWSMKMKDRKYSLWMLLPSTRCKYHRHTASGTCRNLELCMFSSTLLTDRPKKTIIILYYYVKTAYKYYYMCSHISTSGTY